ncbi:hypothetical protein ACMDCT_06380 [Halomonadaceae bacterium KBTZ08]
MEPINDKARELASEAGVAITIEHYSDEDVETAIEQYLSTFVHASFKAHNSKVTETGGIRIGAKRFPFPHLCAHALYRDGIDRMGSVYTKQDTASITIVSQAFKNEDQLQRSNLEVVKKAAKAGDRQSVVITCLTNDQRNRIRNYHEQVEKVRSEAEVTGMADEEVPGRTPQICLPYASEDGQTQHLALTPVPVVETAQQLRQATSEKNERKRELDKRTKDNASSQAERDQSDQLNALASYVKTLDVGGFGGSNPQNVMQQDKAYPLKNSVIVSDVPREDPEVRFAYRLAYKGVDIKLPQGWARGIRQACQDENRYEIRRLCRRLAGSVLRQIRHQRKILLRHAGAGLEVSPDALPCMHRLTEREQRITHGCFWPESRPASWPEEMAGFVRDLVIHKTRVRGQDAVRGDQGRDIHNTLAEEFAK